MSIIEEVPIDAEETAVPEDGEADGPPAQPAEEEPAPAAKRRGCGAGSAWPRGSGGARRRAT